MGWIHLLNIYVRQILSYHRGPQFGKLWSKFHFSDESTIQQFAQKKRTVCRPVGSRFNDCYTQATVKHPPGVMIWGAMSSNGTAGFFLLPIGTTMNGVKYREMLEDKLEIYMTIHECNMLMQDSAPCHPSKLVSDFLKKNLKLISN